MSGTLHSSPAFVTARGTGQVPSRGRRGACYPAGMRSRRARTTVAVLLALAAGPAAAQAYTRQAYVEPSPRTIEQPRPGRALLEHAGELRERRPG